MKQTSPKQQGSNSASQEIFMEPENSWCVHNSPHTGSSFLHCFFLMKCVRHSLFVCFCADIVHDMWHSNLQLVCDGCHPRIILHFEDRFIAHQVKVACEINSTEWYFEISIESISSGFFDAKIKLYQTFQSVHDMTWHSTVQNLVFKLLYNINYIA
jgi:hypothetical protein